MDAQETLAALEQLIEFFHKYNNMLDKISSADDELDKAA